MVPQMVILIMDFTTLEPPVLALVIPKTIRNSIVNPYSQYSPSQSLSGKPLCGEDSAHVSAYVRRVPMLRKGDSAGEDSCTIGKYEQW